MHADELFTCRRLECLLRRRVCVARQLLVELELRGDLGYRSSRRKRGIAPELVSCLVCPQGSAIRQALGDAVAATVRSGPRRGEAGLAALFAIRTAKRERPPGEPMIIDHL